MRKMIFEELSERSNNMVKDENPVTSRESKNMLATNTDTYIDLPEPPDKGMKHASQWGHITNTKKQERKYVCGCGKNYLSDAALYNHIKIKHAGLSPHGTTTRCIRKQGRPNNSKWGSSMRESEMQKKYKLYDDFKYYAKMVSGLRYSKQPEALDFVVDFPKNIFTRTELFEDIFSHLCELSPRFKDICDDKCLGQFDGAMTEAIADGEINCDKVFALYLIYTSIFVSKSFYQELVCFTVTYRLMMNEQGWKKYEELNPDENINTNIEFSKTHTAELVPDFTNMFLLDYLYILVQTNCILKDPNVLVYMGLDAIKILRALLLVNHFCSWLNISKLSFAKLEIYKD